MDINISLHIDHDDLTDSVDFLDNLLTTLYTLKSNGRVELTETPAVKLAPVAPPPLPATPPARRPPGRPRRDAVAPVTAATNGATAPTASDDDADEMFAPAKPAAKPVKLKELSEPEQQSLGLQLIQQVYQISAEGKAAVQKLRRTLKVAKFNDAPAAELLARAMELAVQFGVKASNAA